MSKETQAEICKVFATEVRVGLAGATIFFRDGSSLIVRTDEESRRLMGLGYDASLGKAATDERVAELEAQIADLEDEIATLHDSNH